MAKKKNRYFTSLLCKSQTPDDRSTGFERGSNVSREWEQATTAAALEVADYVLRRLNDLSGGAEPGPASFSIHSVLPHKLIEQRLQAAVKAVLPEADAASVLVRPCPDPKFGDYQSNALMALARSRKLNPRQLAADVLARLDVREWCEPVEIAGAGVADPGSLFAAVGQAIEMVRRSQ